MLGVEPLHLDELDVGVLGPVRGFTGNPPLRTGQTCGQVCASPGIMSLLRSTALGNDFAVSRFPKPDGSRLIAKHNGVIPTPYHCIGAARHLSDGYQMTGRDPFRPGPRELRCVTDRDNLTLGQDSAYILFDAQHDAAVESRDSERVPGRSSHSAIMPRRPRPRPDTLTPKQVLYGRDMSLCWFVGGQDEDGRPVGSGRRSHSTWRRSLPRYRL
jgi:hypothetical protein